MRESKFGALMAIQSAMVWLLAFGMQEGTAIQTNSVFDGVEMIMALVAIFFIAYTLIHQGFELWDLYTEEYA